MLRHIRGERKDDLQIQKSKRAKKKPPRASVTHAPKPFLFTIPNETPEARPLRGSRESTGDRDTPTRRRELPRHVALPRWSVRWRSPHRPGEIETLEADPGANW
ncbi:hypothetical protein NL676_022370 [Syzygium grande]|nr:hypothetical protein NL676_022370 [Syzygium grande]